VTVSSRKPVDFLSRTGSRFYIHRLPNTSFIVQKVNLPGIALQSPTMNTPFSNIPKAGDHILYNELELEFLVDQDLSNYMEIYNWIKGLGKPDSFSEYSKVVMEPGTREASDGVLHILDAKKQPLWFVNFHLLVPISLSDLVFDTRVEAFEYISVTAVFQYRSFSFDSIPGT
jgi:hypothetical protein